MVELDVGKFLAPDEASSVFIINERHDNDILTEILHQKGAYKASSRLTVLVEKSSFAAIYINIRFLY